jgi:hypothetical protein
VETAASGCQALIVVDDPAEDLLALDIALMRPGHQRYRATLTQALVRAAAVEKLDVGAQHPVEMPLIQALSHKRFGRVG